MPKFLKKLNNRGFTLIEMIVSLGIITTLIAVFLVNYRGTSKRTSLTMSAQKMVTDIRLAQNKTLGSVKYKEEIPLGGWGVHFDLAGDNTSYLIFADLDGDSEYESGEGDYAHGARQISLPNNVFIQAIDVGNLVDVTFVPPDPNTIIDYGSGTSTEMTITLKENWNNTTKNININLFGLIEVVD